MTGLRIRIIHKAAGLPDMVQPEVAVEPGGYGTVTEEGRQEPWLHLELSDDGGLLVLTTMAQLQRREHHVQRSL